MLHTRSTDEPRGQVLVIFAGSILLLLMLAAVVVDVSWYWVNSLRIQRAADAAALAGAVMLPNRVADAYTLADEEATKAVDEHGDQIAKGIDKAANAANTKTQGKHGAHLDKAAGMAKDRLDKLDGRNDDIPPPSPRAQPPAS